MENDCSFVNCCNLDCHRHNFNETKLKQSVRVMELMKSSCCFTCDYINSLSSTDIKSFFDEQKDNLLVAHEYLDTLLMILSKIKLGEKYQTISLASSTFQELYHHSPCLLLVLYLSGFKAFENVLKVDNPDLDRIQSISAYIRNISTPDVVKYKYYNIFTNSNDFFFSSASIYQSTLLLLPLKPVLFLPASSAAIFKSPIQFIDNFIIEMNIYIKHTTFTIVFGNNLDTLKTIFPTPAGIGANSPILSFVFDTYEDNTISVTLSSLVLSLPQLHLSPAGIAYTGLYAYTEGFTDSKLTIEQYIYKCEENIYVEEKDMNNQNQEEICPMGQKPITTVFELGTWGSPSNTAGICKVPLNKREPHSGMKVLYCHDMMGGYKYDTFTQGREGTDHVLELLFGPDRQQNERNGIVSEFYINQLIYILQVYNFDGYLINIESPLPQQAISALSEFLRKLKKGLKQISDTNLVIFYDSLVTSGDIYYQNGLTNQNKLFFDCCDALFVNYWWKPDSLKNTISLAGSRVQDIYMGIDIFGRGTYGGGGKTTYTAIQELYKTGLSVALFAPGYLYENIYMEKLKELSSENSHGNINKSGYIYIDNTENNDVYRYIQKDLYSDSRSIDSIYRTIEDEWWYGYKEVVNSRGRLCHIKNEHGIAYYTYERPIGSSLPFYSNFNQSHTYNEYINGDKANDKETYIYNLGNMEVNPTFRKITADHGAEMDSDISFSDGYNSGNCLNIHGDLGGSIKSQSICIYKFDELLINEPTIFQVIYKGNFKESNWSFYVSISINKVSTTVFTPTSPTQQNASDSRETLDIETEEKTLFYSISPFEQSGLIPPRSVYSLGNNWYKAIYCVSPIPYNNSRGYQFITGIKEFGVHMESDIYRNDISLSLGHIYIDTFSRYTRLLKTKATINNIIVSPLISRDSKHVVQSNKKNVLISWTVSNENIIYNNERTAVIDYYRVYRNKQYIGKTIYSFYYLPKPSSPITVTIQPVYIHGDYLPLESCISKAIQ
ncbi:hypothetical protein WA158_003623 [Blastocystis sp. Blastoise]